MAFSDFNTREITLEMIEGHGDANKLQGIIDALAESIKTIEAQLEYRTEAPKGWEQSAITSLGAQKFLHSKAVNQYRRLTGRTDDNRLANEMERQNKLQQKANNIEQQKIETEKRKLKAEAAKLGAIRHALNMTRTACMERSFFAAARKVLEPSIFAQIEAQAIDDANNRMAKAVENTGIAALLEVE